MRSDECTLPIRVYLTLDQGRGSCVLQFWSYRHLCFRGLIDCCFRAFPHVNDLDCVCSISTRVVIQIKVAIF